MYGTLTGNVSRSGNTVTLSSMTLSITPRYSSSGTSNWSFTVHNSTFSGRINHPPTSISIPNTSFGVSTTQTSASVGWSSSDGYSGSFSVSFPSGATSPTGLTVSVVGKGPDYVTMATSINSYGTPSSANDRYISAIIWSKDLAQYGGNPHMETKAYRSTSATLTVNNSSEVVWGKVNILPNTLYSYGAFATNTSIGARVYHQAGVVTTPNAPTCTVSEVTPTSATINYSYASDGGASKQDLIYYEVGQPHDAQKVGEKTGGASGSGSFVIEDLEPNTRYLFSVRWRDTTGAESPAATVEVTTSTEPSKLYGSVNGFSKRINKLYGSVNGETKEIVKLYGSVDGQTKRVF